MKKSKELRLLKEFVSSWECNAFVGNPHCGYFALFLVPVSSTAGKPVSMKKSSDWRGYCRKHAPGKLPKGTIRLHYPGESAKKMKKIHQEYSTPQKAKKGPSLYKYQ